MLILGFAANGEPYKSAGGVNYQCLPLNPQSDQHDIPADGFYSTLYGTEYQNHEYPSSLPKGTHDNNVPCSRCHTGRGALMMIPARRDCPSEWVLEYNGK